MNSIFPFSFVCVLISCIAQALHVDTLNALAIDPRYEHSVQLLTGTHHGSLIKHATNHGYSPCSLLSAHALSPIRAATLLSFLEKQPVPITYTLDDMQAHIPDFSNPRILKNCTGTLVLTLIDIWCTTCFKHNSHYSACTRISIRSLECACTELDNLTATAQLVRNEAKKYSYEAHEDRARTDPQERALFAQLGRVNYYYGMRETQQALYNTIVESTHLREILQTAQKKEKITRLKKSCCVS